MRVKGYNSDYWTLDEIKLAINATLQNGFNWN
jgi:hypothetical protein